MITKRVDMKGNSHILKGNPPQEITTPHVHEYGRNHNALVEFKSDDLILQKI